MYNPARIIHLAEMYTVGTENGDRLMERSDPFVHGVKLLGPRGEIVRIKGVFDDGAMINAIDQNVFDMVRKRLEEPKTSARVLQMANGTLIPSKGLWLGTINMMGIMREGSFKIFPSGGSWALLFGKPLLTTFGMVHHYDNDTITIPHHNGAITMPNEFGRTRDAQTATVAGVSLTADIKQREAFGGNIDSPSRQVLSSDQMYMNTQTGNLETSTHTQIQETPAKNGTEEGEEEKGKGEKTEIQESRTTVADGLEPTCATTLGDDSSPVREVPPANRHSLDKHNIDNLTSDISGEHQVFTLELGEPTGAIDDTKAEKVETPQNADKSVFTRATEPFKAERVAKILEFVTIGDDLSEQERERVRELVKEYADCFALSVSEVRTVKGGEHRLDIKPGTKFTTKIMNRPFTPPQKVYLNKVLDDLLDSGVIRSIAAEDVKCCSQITLAQKAHTNEGLTITELQHRVNDECVQAGLPSAHNLPPREAATTDATPDLPKEPKWRFCMNFAELNKATMVRPMPQGNIRAMQHSLSGKRWISNFDFASGFTPAQWLQKANRMRRSTQVHVAT